jgi:branched-chain amino acid transport system permease protein
MNVKYLIGFVLIISLILFPLFANPSLVHVMILIFLYAFLGESWNILGGLAGQLSLGHAIFFGLGAYLSTLLSINLNVSPWLGLIIAGFTSSMVGVVISYPVFHYKLRGAYFALVTLAYGEIFEKVATRINLTGGALGLVIPLKEESWWAFQFKQKIPYYYIIFALTVIAVGITYWIKRSRMGYLLAGIREDEDAAEALGVEITRYKLWATAISAFLTAVGGVFYAQYVMFIDPKTTLSVFLSIEIILRPIIGGMGTVFGPILGSFLLTPLSELARVVMGGGRSGVHLLVYGIALIVVCLLMPKGIAVVIGNRLTPLFRTKPWSPKGP